MKLRVWVLATMAGGATLTACGHHFDPPNRSKQVAEAEAQYTPAVFDSVKWATDSIRALDGNATYAASCRKCHGTVGRGNTDYDQAHNLKPPSLVRPNWGYDSLDSLRKRIWVGHAGMPTFGIAGITPRDIDGVAYYLVHVLRPDELGKNSGG